MHGLGWCTLYACTHCLPACPALMQEEMYSFVTVADDQLTKGKGTVVVADA